MYLGWRRTGQAGVPEHLTGTVAKLPLISDCIVWCNVSVAEEVNEGGVAGGVGDWIDTLAPRP